MTVHTHAEAPAMRLGRSGPLDQEPLSGLYICVALEKAMLSQL